MLKIKKTIYKHFFSLFFRWTFGKFPRKEQIQMFMDFEFPDEENVRRIALRADRASGATVFLIVYAKYLDFFGYSVELYGSRYALRRFDEILGFSRVNAHLWMNLFSERQHGRRLVDVALIDWHSSLTEKDLEIIKARAGEVLSIDTQ